MCSQLGIEGNCVDCYSSNLVDCYFEDYNLAVAGIVENLVVFDSCRYFHSSDWIH